MQLVSGLVRLRPWLMVGAARVTEDARLLRAQQVGAMLQLHRRKEQSDIVSLFLPHIEDGYPLPGGSLRQGLGFISAQRMVGRSVLIACGAGVSRSVTFAIGALKDAEGLSLAAAYRDIRRLHPSAMPDQVHWDSLRQHYGEGPPFWEVWEQILLDLE